MKNNVLIIAYISFAFGMGLLSNYISKKYNLDQFGVGIITLSLMTPVLVFVLEKIK